MRDRFWYLLAGFVISLGIAVAMFFMAGGTEIFKRGYTIDEVRKLSHGGDFEEAIRIANKIIEENTDRIESIRLISLELFILLGELYTQKKEYSQASKNIGKALKIDPENSLALRTMGVLYKEENKPELAEEYFKKAIGFAKKDIDRAHAHFGLGRLYSKEGRKKEAIIKIKKAIDFYPEEPSFGSELSKIEHSQ